VENRKGKKAKYEKKKIGNLCHIWDTTTDKVETSSSNFHYLTNIDFILIAP
jgi:hypothetical protein